MEGLSGLSQKGIANLKALGYSNEAITEIVKALLEPELDPIPSIPSIPCQGNCECKCP